MPLLSLLEASRGCGDAVVQAALDELEDQQELATMAHCLQQLHQVSAIGDRRGGPDLPGKKTESRAKN